jgi:hypothetical protein
MSDLQARMGIANSQWENQQGVGPGWCGIQAKDHNMQQPVVVLPTSDLHVRRSTTSSQWEK